MLKTNNIIDDSNSFALPFQISFEVRRKRLLNYLEDVFPRLSSSFLDILEDGAAPLLSRTKGFLVSQSAKESEEYRFAQGPSLIRLAVVWPISNWLATPYAY